VYTFGQLKTEIRGRIWPSGESDRLVAAHDKLFVDALGDLQTWVKCLLQDHTDVVPQCATYYNCGLTVMDAPRGRILRLSVIDKINPDTLLEDADSPDDYCREIVYNQVDPCYIRSYLSRSQSCGACLSIPLYFGLPLLGCGAAAYPVPTDEGVPSGLPVLPLGYHYPQTSTDRTYGRSFFGVWAIERGKIYVAPWIQSTETILLTWDGLKRTWTDQDPVDPDPMLSQAVEEYVRWHHASKYDKDPAEAERASGAFNLARQMLIHECREETRVRACEPSHARSASLNFGTLYYNDEQVVTASCPDNQTGSPVTITIPAGTVGSNRSVSDANRIAREQGVAQAEAQLVCTDIPVTYTNTVPGDFTATCVSTDSAAPAPTGNPVRVLIPVGTVSGATVEEANSNAQQEAEAQAYAQLSGNCTYYNSPRTSTKYCISNPTLGPGTGSVAAGAYSASTQNAANQLAQTDADNQAIAELAGVCPDDFDDTGSPYYNTQIQLPFSKTFVTGSYSNQIVWTVLVRATMPGATVQGKTQGEANTAATNLLTSWANEVVTHYTEWIVGHTTAPYCATSNHTCAFLVTYPNAPWPPQKNFA
jgi:hypothetical protein